MPRPKIAPAIDKEVINQLYNIELLSTYDISKQLSLPVHKVRAAVKYWGYQLRSKSEAQKLVLETGKQIHPTRGKTRTKSERENIGRAIVENYNNKGEAYKQKRSDEAKSRWENLSDDTKEKFRTESAKALAKSAKEGSILERSLVDKLIVSHYNIESQVQGRIANEDFRLDILINNKIALELDGEAHHRDLFNEPDKYAKKRLRDFTKDALLINAGYYLIRVAYSKQLSNARIDLLFKDLINIIENISSYDQKEVIRINVNV